MAGCRVDINWVCKTADPPSPSQIMTAANTMSTSDILSTYLVSTSGVVRSRSIFVDIS